MYNSSENTIFVLMDRFLHHKHKILMDTIRASSYIIVSGSGRFENKNKNQRHYCNLSVERAGGEEVGRGRINLSFRKQLNGVSWKHPVCALMHTCSLWSLYFSPFNVIYKNEPCIRWPGPATSGRKRKKMGGEADHLTRFLFRRAFCGNAHNRENSVRPRRR